TLGDLMHLTKRFGEAEAEYQEALRIQKRVMKTLDDDDSFKMRQNTRIYKVLLAGMANVLLQLGNTQESEKVARRALEIEGAALPDYWSYSIVGTILRLVNKTSEARAALDDYAEVSRKIVEMDGQLISYLVDPLVNLGILLTQTGKLTEAEGKIREAFDIASEVSEKEPERGEALSALSHRNIAAVFHQAGKYSEAEKAYTESLEFYRQAAELFPNRYQDIVADVLNSLAITLRHAGKGTKAERAYLEALDISKRLVHDFPEAVFLDDLQAVLLSNYGVYLRSQSRNLDGLESYQKAIEILKRLADKSPDLFLHNYATTLNNLGVLLSEVGEDSEAEGRFKECLRIRRELREKSLEVFLPKIASCLNNLGIVLMKDDQMQAAEKALREAIAIQEELAASEPRFYQQPLGRTINNLIILLSKTGNTDEIGVLTKRLGELGIEEPAQDISWSEEEMRASITYFWIY
ncbi:MAG: tetratricopeptide repeat protein, partial [Candidatus Thorarchaeota archaeon]